ATATDNCDNAPVISHSDQAIANGIQRTWKATDACGNEATCVQTITFTDTTAPIITCPTNITVSCVADVPAADTNTVVVSDSCSSVTVSFVSDATDTNTCPETITRTYKAMDGSGNEATCVQIITVHNQIAPVITCPANAQLECGASSDPSNTGTATATDTCGGQPVIGHSDVVVGGSIQRTWTATDAWSNKST